MSLQPQRLDPGITFDNAHKTPYWIVGRGQKIYWRRCFIQIVTTTNEVVAPGNTETSDGQAVVPQGTVLFLGGDDGRVKEEQVASVAASSSAIDPSSDAAFTSTLTPPRSKRPRLNGPQVTDSTSVEPFAAAGPSPAAVSSSDAVLCPDSSSSLPKGPSSESG
ncbi:hypothetical protein F4859DRAFT_137697 [Xylaria cf. heliscus]|nr:hypothetical protein F4859DRAFT_137697 [Xylaria cf. heliscus]